MRFFTAASSAVRTMDSPFRPLRVASLALRPARSAWGATLPPAAGSWAAITRGFPSPPGPVPFGFISGDATARKEAGSVTRGRERETGPACGGFPASGGAVPTCVITSGSRRSNAPGELGASDRRPRPPGIRALSLSAVRATSTKGLVTPFEGVSSAMPQLAHATSVGFHLKWNPGSSDEARARCVYELWKHKSRSST